MILRQLKKTLSSFQKSKNKRLTLIEAKKWVRWLRTLAIPLKLSSFVLLCMGAFKFIYFLPWQTDALSSVIGHSIKELIEILFIMPPFISNIWKIAPVPTLEPINSLANYCTALLGCAAIIAKLMLNSARHLSGQIKNAQMDQWMNQIEGKENQNISRFDITSIEITTTPRDQWYTQPFGKIMIAVASGVLLQVINLSLGLK